MVRAPATKSPFQSRDVCFDSETLSLHWKFTLRNAWGQQNCVSTLWNVLSASGKLYVVKRDQQVNAANAELTCMVPRSSEESSIEVPTKS